MVATCFLVFLLLTSDPQDCPPLPRPEPRLATVGVYPSLPLVPAPTSRISVDYTLYDDEIAAYTSNSNNNNNTATPPTYTPPAVTNQKNKFEPKNEVCILYNIVLCQSFYLLIYSLHEKQLNFSHICNWTLL